MLDIKSVNYFSGSKNSIGMILSKFIRFYDMIGNNTMVMYQNDSDSGLAPWLKDINNKPFINSDDFIETLKNNLFRLDCLVVDMYKFRDSNYTTILSWKSAIKNMESKIRDITDIPIIFVIPLMKASPPDISELSELLKDSNSTFYKLDISYQKNNPTSVGLLSTNCVYKVTDVFNGWSADIEDLKRAYIRDKKLEHLLEDDEDE